ncbi:MAG: hypothetical protein WD046_05365 [Paracoccaceae bacterium]
MSEETEIITRLDAAATSRPALPSGLMERVLADAMAAQLSRQPQGNVLPMARPRPALGLMSSAALAASALIGLLLGYSSPDLLGGVAALAELVAGSSSSMGTGIDELGALSAFLAEG